jgi:hypothetical protein
MFLEMTINITGTGQIYLYQIVGKGKSNQDLRTIICEATRAGGTVQGRCF